MSILVSVRILISLFDLIHFLIFFNTAGAPQIVGSNPCTWGPGFWCASYANARQCDVLLIIN
jgi:hypothetical protein